MKLRLFVPIAAAAAALCVAGPASAQNKPTIAILPAGYFAADQASADRFQEGLRAAYENQGYRVVDAGDAATAAGYSRNMHYPDRVAVQIGRRAGADLVVYPRLLALGIPLAANDRSGLQPEAVVHVRVMNVHTGNNIYFRQVGHEFVVDQVAENFALPQPIATASAQEVTGMYFDRVAGSRQETRNR